MIFRQSNVVDSLQLSIVSQDSICLYIPDLKETTIIKKINSGVGNRKLLKSDLIGRAFEFQMGDDFQRRLNFVNDSIVLLNSHCLVANWAILSYKNYNFFSSNIVVDFPDLAIAKDDSGNITLSGAYTKSYEYLLKPVRSKFEKSQILGDWVEVERSYYQHLPAVRKMDTLEYLSITESRFTRKGSGFENSMKWELSPDGEVVYFPKQGTKRYYSEKIQDISDTTMTLYKLNMHHLGDSISVAYKNIN